MAKSRLNTNAIVNRNPDLNVLRTVIEGNAADHERMDFCDCCGGYQRLFLSTLNTSDKVCRDCLKVEKGEYEDGLATSERAAVFKVIGFRRGRQVSHS